VSDHQRSKPFLGIDPSRRSFIAKFAAAVFAAPVVTSFALDGVALASKPDHQHHGNQVDCKGYLSNQYLHNQHLYNQTLYNQTLHNQMLCNQMLHNQMLCNQMLSNQTDHHHHHRHGHDSSWWAYGECLPLDNHRHRRGWVG
jgi:hypothetical protein